MSVIEPDWTQLPPVRSATWRPERRRSWPHPGQHWYLWVMHAQASIRYGYASLVIHPERCVLRLIWVYPSQRGSGWGSVLLQAVLAVAGTRQVRLRVEAEQDSALENEQLLVWYQRHGFQLQADGWLEKPGCKQ